MIDTIVETFIQKLNTTKASYKRYMHYAIDMNEPLIGILGPRGAGKTTFLLQYLKALDLPLSKKLYFAADHVDVADMTLYGIAKEFYARGGELLVIDEIHKYADFERELKSIRDTFELKVIFTGSSALRLEHAKADLSRRAKIHRIGGLSFREFCELESGKELRPYTLDELLHHHTDIAYELTQKIRPYEFFGPYLKYGVYPFYLENRDSCHDKLNEIMNVVIETDLTQIFNINPENIGKLKKTVAMLSRTKPYELNMSEFTRKVGIHHQTFGQYLEYLFAGSIITKLYAMSRGDKALSKPDKLYLNNTNLAYALAQNVEIGTIREIFALHQLSQKHTLHYPAKGDFLIDETYTLEVGGESKSFKQIKETPHAYLAIDGITVGSGNRIPLWLFGFLY